MLFQKMTDVMYIELLGDVLLQGLINGHTLPTHHMWQGVVWVCGVCGSK